MKVGRRTKRILGGLAALLLLFLLLHTGPAKWGARRLVSSVLGRIVDGEATIEVLDYRLLFGELEIGGLATSPDDGSYRLAARSVRLSITGLPKLSLEIEEPELAVSRVPEGSAGAGPAAPLAFLRYLGAVRIEHGVLELLGRMRFEGVDAELLESSEGHRLLLHAGGGRVRVSEQEVDLGPLDADAVLTPETIHVVSASLYKDASFVRAEGPITFGGRVGGELRFEAALEARLARLVNDAVDLRGVLAATGRLSLLNGSPRVEARLRSEELGYRDVVARNLGGDAELDQGELRIRDLGAEAFGGRWLAQADLSLDPSGGRTVELHWEEVDPSELSFALAAERLPLSSRSAGTMQIDLGDFSLERWAGSAELRLRPVASATLPSAAGSVRAALRSGSVTLSKSNWTISNPRGEVDVEGTIGLGGSLDVAVSASVEPGSLPSLPIAAEGAVGLEGRIYGRVPALAWTARLSSRSLVIRDVPLELAGTISGDLESATIDDLELSGTRGRVEVRGIAPLSTRRRWSLDLSGSGELPELGPLKISVASVSGHVEGPARSPDGSAFLRLDPVSLYGREGEAQLSITKTGENIRIEDLRGSVGTLGTIVGAGTYGIVSETVEAELQVDALGLEGVVPGLVGWASLDLSLRGTRAAPEGAATVRFEDLVLNERTLPDARVTARAEGGRASIQGSLGEASLLEGTLALQAPFPLHLEAELGAVPWTELLRAWDPELAPAVRLQAGGVAILDAELSHPRELRYGANVEELVLTTRVGTATSSPVRVEGDLSGLSLRGLSLEGPRGRLSLVGAVPFGESGALDVAVDGKLPLETFRELAPDLEVQGEVIAALRVTGSWNAPRLQGDLNVAGSSGRFRDLAWSDVTLSAHSSLDRIDALALRGNLLGGRVELEGQIPLRSQAEPGRVELTLEGVDLGPLLDDEESEAIRALVSLDGEIEVAGPSLAELSGRGELRALWLHARDRTLELGDPVTFRLDGERLDVSPMTLRGEGSELSLRLRLVDRTSTPKVEASVSGAIDLSVVDALFGELPELSTEGKAALEVEASYSKDGLALSGTGGVSGGRLTLTRPRFALSAVSAGFELEGSRILVKELSATAGSGSLKGEGFIDLAPDGFGLDLRADAARLPLELMDGLRIETSGSIRLASTDDALRLTGNLSLDRGLLTREIDDEDMGFSRRQASLRSPTEGAELADRLSLDVTIATRRNLVIENSMAQLEIAGNLSLQGTVGAPEVGGIVTVLPDGYLQIGRNRFQVRQGRADLRGFPQAPPRLELAAVTRVGQTLIQIELEGESDDLSTRLTAPENPGLTEGDLASLLVTGRTLEDAAEGGQQMATTWMMASLADLVHQGLGNLITYGPPPGAGPVILAEEADPTSRLTLGVPLTDRFSATYSIALNDAENRLWILDYRVARNIWLRAIQENGSDFALGVSQRFALDLRGRSPAGSRDRVSPESVERLAEVSVRGAPAGFEWQPAARAGERFDYWTAQDEARSLTEKLVQRGYVSATVDVRTEAADSGRVRLTFEVVAGKLTKFVWRGDDPGKDLRRSIERAWDGRIPETFLLPDLAERVRTKLEAQRYYLARVDARAEDVSEPRYIVFDVARGPRGDRLEIVFVGNGILDQKTLREVLPADDDPALFLLFERRTELGRGVRLRYASEGYLDASVGELERDYDAKTRVFRVEIPVDEGRVTRIASIAFAGDKAFETGKLEGELGLAVGDAVDFTAIRRGEGRIRTLYREEGFPEIRLRTVLSRSAEGVEISVGLEEGARARVGDIRVVGNIRTRESVIRHELTFRQGDPVRVTDFQNSQKRLYDLGILRTADVRVDAAQQGQLRQDVLVQVDEKPDLDVSYGIRYNFLTSSQSLDSELEARGKSLEGVARINVVNPTGFGSSAGFSIFVEKGHRLYRGNFRLPMAFGKRIITEIVLDSERDEDRLDIPGLDLRRDSVTFQQTKKLRDQRYDKLALQWNVSYARYRGQTVHQATGAVIDFETYRPRFGISFIDDRRDSFANPTRGRFWNVNLQYTPGIWGSDVSYYRLYGQFFYYYPLVGRLVWASGVRLGFAPGERPFLLIDDRFQAGGANSVRGFRQNALGPSVKVEATGEEVFIGGQAVSVFNQELRFPLFKSLHGGVFWDVGNVFARASDFRIPDLRQSVGAGLRYVLSFGAIRLDWARVLDPREDESRYRFHFSFGYAF